MPLATDKQWVKQYGQLPWWRCPSYFRKLLKWSVETSTQIETPSFEFASYAKKPVEALKKGEVLEFGPDGKRGVWRSVGGSPIFIEVAKGESVPEAVKRQTGDLKGHRKADESALKGRAVLDLPPMLIQQVSKDLPGGFDDKDRERFIGASQEEFDQLVDAHIQAGLDGSHSPLEAAAQKFDAASLTKIQEHAARWVVWTQHVVSEGGKNATIKLYRGQEGEFSDDSLKFGILSSWTNDREVAETFAERYGRKGRILEVEVPIKNILLSSTSHPRLGKGFEGGIAIKEQEYLVLNKGLSSLVQVHTLSQQEILQSLRELMNRTFPSDFSFLLTLGFMKSGLSVPVAAVAALSYEDSKWDKKPEEKTLAQIELNRSLTSYERKVDFAILDSETKKLASQGTDRVKQLLAESRDKLMALITSRHKAGSLSAKFVLDLELRGLGQLIPTLREVLGTSFRLGQREASKELKKTFAHYTSDFDEEDHPREDDGKFAPKGSGSEKISSKQIKGVLSTMLSLVEEDSPSWLLQQLKDDPDTDVLVADGRSWSTAGLTMRQGLPNQCHLNTSRLYKKGKIDAIVVGYAHDGEQWRSHTWGLRDNKIVETTFRFKKYFGGRLSKGQSKSFAIAQERVFKESQFVQLLPQESVAKAPWKHLWNGDEDESHSYQVKLDPTGLPPEKALEFFERKAVLWGADIRQPLLGQVKNILFDGIKQGTPLRDLMARIGEAYLPWLGDPDQAIDEIMLTPYRLETLVRTNITEALNEGRKAQFQEAVDDGFVIGLQYSAIMDARTTEVCKHLDGKIFPPNSLDTDRLSAPRHWNCRAIWTPVTRMEGPVQYITQSQVAKGIELSGKGFREDGESRQYEFNEEDHPRVAAGEEGGGQFTSGRGGGESGGEEDNIANELRNQRLREAVRFWVAGSSSERSDMNSWLREGKKLDRSEERRLQQHVDALDEAIFDSKLDEEIVVYRGSPNLGQIDFIKDKGFLAVSRSRETAERFASGYYDGQVYEIRLPKGSHVLDIAETGFGKINEGEFLLPRNIKFPVKILLRKASFAQYASDFDEEDHPREDDGKFAPKGGGSESLQLEEEFQREVIIIGDADKEHLLKFPIQEGVRAFRKAGQCTQCTLAEYQKTGTDVYMGTAVLRTRYEEAKVAYKKDGTFLGTNAFPHAWNVKNGKIFDRALGTEFAKEHLYFGFKVPSEVMSQIKDGDELARWYAKNSRKEYAASSLIHYTSDFDESDHPREDNGKFAPKGSSGESSSNAKSEDAIRAIGTGKERIFVNADGSPVDEATQARINALGIPPAWTGVQVSADPQSPLQAIGYDKSGKEQPRYSKQHTTAANAAKHLRVAALAQDGYKKMVAGVASDLNKGVEEAVVMSLVLSTAMRIGGDSEKAVGATTLEAQHLNVDGDMVRFDFPGKSGKRWEGTIRNEALAKQISARLTGKSGTDRVFSSNASKVNSYLKQYGKMSAKDVRTLQGTSVAMKELKKLGEPKTLKEAKQHIKIVSTKVSEHLRNTPAVAKSSYINPAVWAPIQAKFGIQVVA